MKKKTITFLLTVILLLAACSPGGSEPAGDATANGALETVDDATATPNAEATASATAATTAATIATAEAEAPTTEPEATPALADLPQDEPVIIFYQSGGIMGLMDEWRFYPTGALVDQNGEQWDLAPAQVEELLNVALAGDFFNLEESYMPENTCCDFFTYTIVIHYGDQNNTVTTMDNAENMPDSLFDTIQAIQEILRAIREGNQPGPVE